MYNNNNIKQAIKNNITSSKLAHSIQKSDELTQELVRGSERKIYDTLTRLWF